MPSLISSKRLVILTLIVLSLSGAALAQRSSVADNNSSEFGPVMRAYLGYLGNEQEVVDDRASRREITPAYYHRNLARIRALRQMAIRLVRQSGNDYVPELEAVTTDELRTLFEQPPRVSTLRANEIVANKFRFLASVQTGELFFLFARLDPYEQAELMERQKSTSAELSSGTTPTAATGQRIGQTSTRPRRASPK